MRTHLATLLLLFAHTASADSPYARAVQTNRGKITAAARASWVAPKVRAAIHDAHLAAANVCRAAGGIAKGEAVPPPFGGQDYDLRLSDGVRVQALDDTRGGHPSYHVTAPGLVVSTSLLRHGKDGGATLHVDREDPPRAPQNPREARAAKRQADGLYHPPARQIMAALDKRELSSKAIESERRTWTEQPAKARPGVQRAANRAGEHLAPMIAQLDAVHAAVDRPVAATIRQRAAQILARVEKLLKSDEIAEAFTDDAQTQYRVVFRSGAQLRTIKVGPAAHSVTLTDTHGIEHRVIDTGAGLSVRRTGTRGGREIADDAGSLDVKGVARVDVRSWSGRPVRP